MTCDDKRESIVFAIDVVELTEDGIFKFGDFPPGNARDGAREATHQTFRRVGRAGYIALNGLYLQPVFRLGLFLFNDRSARAGFLASGLS